MSTDANESSSEALNTTLAECAEALTWLVAPAAYERACGGLPRGEAQRAVEARLGTLLEILYTPGDGGEAPDEALERVVPWLERTRAHVHAWRYGTAPPPALADAARAALEALVAVGATATPVASMNEEWDDAL